MYPKCGATAFSRPGTGWGSSCEPYPGGPPAVLAGPDFLKDRRGEQQIDGLLERLMIDYNLFCGLAGSMRDPQLLAKNAAGGHLLPDYFVVFAVGGPCHDAELASGSSGDDVPLRLQLPSGAGWRRAARARGA